MTRRVRSREGGPRLLWRVGDEPLPIPDATVRRAIRLVRASGVIPVVAIWKAAARKGPGGRPETFPLLAVLVGLWLLAMSREPLLLTEVTKVLLYRISPAMRAELGVPDPPDPYDSLGQWGVYRNVRNRFHGLLALMDPSPNPKNRRLTPERFAAAVAIRQEIFSPADWALREERLGWFVNQIIEASLSELPADLRAKYRGHLAVDATVIPAFSRQDARVRRVRKGVDPEIITHSADPDADWYTRDREAKDGGPGGKHSVWGYEASYAVSGSIDDTQPFPVLVMGMAVLHKPSHRPGANGIRAIASIHERGWPAGFLAGDMAYGNAKADDYHLPARAMGYKLVFDYPKDRRGRQGSEQGMPLVEGSYYCPCMPEVLISAVMDFDAGRIDEATYRLRLEERARWRILTKARPDAEGFQRLRCPASEPNPVAGCALKPRSLRPEARGTPTRRRLDVTVLASVERRPPVICSQQSITVAPGAGAKHLQDLPYRSEAWETAYHQLRNSIEGMNGFAKDHAKEALGASGRRRVRGVAAQSLFVSFQLAGANLRKISAYVAEKRAIDAGTMRRLPRRRQGEAIQAFLPEAAGAGHGQGPGPPRTA